MNYKTIIIAIVITIIIAGGGYLAWKYYFKSKPKMLTDSVKPLDKPLDLSTNSQVEEFINFEDTSTNPYFDINQDDKLLGRVVFQLFDEDVPLTCKNFRYLVSQSMFKKDIPSYQNVPFHRVIKDFMIQSGDITKGDGTGGMSIYGEKFADENLTLEHNQEGLLSMANSGPDTNNSQFFITTKKTPWLDNKHVVFGIVLTGYDIITNIENTEVDDNDKPVSNIYISKCGLLPKE